jgi:hypothetical protein
MHKTESSRTALGAVAHRTFQRLVAKIRRKAGVSLALMLLLPPSLARSQPADLTARCEQKVLFQGDAASNPAREFALDLRGRNGARLVYFGVLRHTFEVTDPQFADMESRWSELQPTDAFYEGTGNFVGDSTKAAVSRSGEPGLVRYLGSVGKTPTHSLEPSRETEVAALLKTFTPEQIVLFFVTRSASEARDRLHQSREDLERTFAQQLAQIHRVPALADALPDMPAFRAAYARWFPGQDAAAAPASWFDPMRTSAETGSRFFNDVNRASSFSRDVFMYRLLADAAKPGARIFAEVGRDHIPAQAAALKCAFQVR